MVLWTQGSFKQKGFFFCKQQANNEEQNILISVLAFVTLHQTQYLKRKRGNEWVDDNGGADKYWRVPITRTLLKAISKERLRVLYFSSSRC